MKRITITTEDSVVDQVLDSIKKMPVFYMVHEVLTSQKEFDKKVEEYLMNHPAVKTRELAEKLLGTKYVVDEEDSYRVEE